MKKILILILFVFVSFLAKAQLIPNAQVWGNTKIWAITTNNDTSGYIVLDQIKAFLAAGSGSVTSVALGVPTGFAVSGSPVTSSGTLSFSINGSANQPLKSNGSGGVTAGAINLASTTEVTGQLANANLANSAINFATGATGTAPNWGASSASLGGTATINIPLAGTTITSGTISNAAQSIDGTKTFNNGVVLSQNLVNSITALTSATTLTTASNHEIYLDASSASFAVTLPTAPTDGTEFTFIKVNTTTNYPTITRGGSDTIMGANNHTLITADVPTTFRYRAGKWRIQQ